MVAEGRGARMPMARRLLARIHVRDEDIVSSRVPKAP
jgi:hypothetical protein